MHDDPLAGLPLLEHSVRLAQLCPEVDTIVVGGFGTGSSSVSSSAAEPKT